LQLNSEYVIQKNLIELEEKIKQLKEFGYQVILISMLDKNSFKIKISKQGFELIQVLEEDDIKAGSFTVINNLIEACVKARNLLDSYFGKGSQNG